MLLIYFQIILQFRMIYNEYGKWKNMNILLQRYIRNYHLVKLQRNEYAMMLSNNHNYAEKKLTADD